MTAGGRYIALVAGVVAIMQAPAIGTGVAAASETEQPAPGVAAPGTVAETTVQPTPGTTPVPQPAAEPPTEPAAAVTLSNERTKTTWVHPLGEASIRAHPAVGSRTIAHTHLATEDGFPEVYLLLSTVTEASGRVWVRVRIPGRPNGRTGWVLREALGEFHVTRWLLQISLGARRIKAYHDGHLRFTFPVGVGKPGTPTPKGRFWIREIFKVPNRGNAYWPYALGTSAYSTLTDWPGGGVVGIHGDFGQPQLIPGAPSHGCVRMHAGDLVRLAPRLQLGTPVHIIP
jgi:hypothetical protein